MKDINSDPIRSFARWLVNKKLERSKHRQAVQRILYILIMVAAITVLSFTQDKPDWIHVHFPCMAAVFFSLALFILDI